MGEEKKILVHCTIFIVHKSVHVNDELTEGRRVKFAGTRPSQW